MEKHKNAKGREIAVSPSSLGTFDDCTLKWYMGYALRLSDEGSAATRLGGLVHDEAEHYLIEGDFKGHELSTPVRILKPGLRFLPDGVVPGRLEASGWGSEIKVSAQAGALSFRGIVDLHNAPGFSRGQYQELVVSDWKTTGNKEFAWAKTSEQLRGFVQPLSYAYALGSSLERTPSTVSFQHINLCTRPTAGKYRAMARWAEGIPWSYIEEQWEQQVLMPSAEMAKILDARPAPQDIYTPFDKKGLSAAQENNRSLMLTLKAKDRADKEQRVVSAADLEGIPYNIKTCSKYGGCSYAKLCPMSPENRSETLASRTTRNKEEREVNSRLAALRAKAGIKTQSTSNEPKQSAPPPAAETPVGTASKVVEAIDKLMAGSVPVTQDRAKALADGAGVPLNEVLAAGNWSSDGGRLVAKEEQAEQSLVGMSESEAKAAIKSRHKIRRLSKAAMESRLQEMGLVIKDGVVAHASSTPELLKADAVDPVPKAEAAALQTGLANKPQEMTIKAAKPMVLVDVRSTSGGTTLEEWLEEVGIIPEVNERLGVPYFAANYNEGIKAVAALVEEQRPAIPVRLLVDSRSPLYAMLLAYLGRNGEIFRPWR